MLERGAGAALEVGVGEVLVDDGADVLVGEVDAGDALVVGRERDRARAPSCRRERVVGVLDAEDDVVGGQVDFDHDVFAAISLRSSAGRSS